MDFRESAPALIFQGRGHANIASLVPREGYELRLCLWWPCCAITSQRRAHAPVRRQLCSVQIHKHSIRKHSSTQAAAHAHTHTHTPGCSQPLCAVFHSRPSREVSMTILLLPPRTSLSALGPGWAHQNAQASEKGRHRGTKRQGEKESMCVRACVIRR